MSVSSHSQRVSRRLRPAAARWLRIAIAVCAASFSLAASADLANFTQKFGAARADYFHGLEGDRSAELRANDEFTALARERPQDPTVLAYAGSLQLLEAAHTWAFWNKHRLATEGLAKIDRSVQLAPDNLEVRFIHAATTWHLPFFYHRKAQAESDFAFIAPRAEQAARHGALPPPLAAAALDYYGQILADRDDTHGARAAFEAAVRIDRKSPGGQDASERLQ